MAIIDLGDVSAPDFEEEPDAPAPSLRRHLVRPLLAAVIVVLSALALAGSGRPAPPTLTEAWSAEIGLETWPYTFGDTIMVTQGTPDTTPVSTAYDLATGQVRWSKQDTSQSGWLNPDTDSDQLYAPMNVRTVEVPNGMMYFGTDTRALDVRTGKSVWERTGDEVAATADEVLLGDRDDRGRVTALHLVRAADGTPVWERQVAATEDVVVSEDPRETARIVLKTADGELTTLRYADGVPLATRRVTRPPSVAGWGPQVLNGQFYDILTGAPDSTVVAYRTDTLTELWRFRTTGEVSVQDCGPVLCVNDIHLTYGVDPATGESLWKLPNGGATVLPGGRILLTGSRDLADSQSVIDARTGRTIRVAPRGTQVLALDDGRLFALGNTKTAPYRVTISAWDPDTGRTALLGAVRGRSDTCQVGGRRLICTGSGRLGVTDLGPR